MSKIVVYVSRVEKISQRRQNRNIIISGLVQKGIK